MQRRRFWSVVVLATVFVLSLAFSVVCHAQSAPENDGSFSLTASAVALPNGRQTVPGTLLGQTKSVTNTVSLRATEFLAPSINVQAYYGGLIWFPGALQKMLSKTKLNTLIPYVTASGGMDIYSPPGFASVRDSSFLAGGGINSCTQSKVRVCVNLGEIQYAYIPRAAGSTFLLSSGLKLTF